MKKDKIAVLIIGNPNSGKTTTIKFFEKEYNEDHREKSVCRAGWRRVQLFLGKLDALSVFIFFIPASPTETNFPVKTRLGEMLPEMILIAEQPGGKAYAATKTFLDVNNYKVIEFNLDRANSKGTWNEWNDKNFEKIMKKRTAEIGDTFTDYVVKCIK
jgi:hypothetical protein